VLCVLATTPLVGQTRYEISAPSPESRLLHIKAEFPSEGRDTLYLSLPAWSPGSYEIQNYARYLRHFTARAGGQPARTAERRSAAATATANRQAGAALFWDRLDKDTWRVVPAGAPSVVVEFDFLADTIDLSLARLREEFGQFLGSNVFMFEENRLDRTAEVRFALPRGWGVTTALRGRGPYTAADYHELADAMTFIGQYALDSVQVDRRWIRLAVWPSTAYTPAVARNLRTSVERLAAVQNRLMGGPPYDVYTIFFMIVEAGVPYGGGLEHSNSHFNILPQPAFADASGNLGDFVIPLVSHEFFHMWNVKRLRPAEMWPYDYREEQYTPLLWWSEGVTDLYADLTNLRAGLWTEEQFLENVGENASTVASAPEPWSVEDGSVATWIHELFVNSSQLYYPEGSLIGLLLDISIRDATDGAKSLDFVMRALFNDFYKKGRGFTTSDLHRLLTENGMPQMDTFYQRYINGRDELPYDSVFSKAGMVMRRDTTNEFSFGAELSLNPAGDIVVQRVLPTGTAGGAGIRTGDVILKLDELDLRPTPQSIEAVRTRFRTRAGSPITFTVRREGEEIKLTGPVRVEGRTQISVTRVDQPTERQQRVWQGLVTGTPAPQ
jgi:predicted metalloprotease with PDZ domain